MEIIEYFLHRLERMASNDILISGVRTINGKGSGGLPQTLKGCIHGDT